MIYFYIGTDGGANFRAEKALEYSISKHCSIPFSIEWMDTSRGGETWQGWNNLKWYTKFSNFRFSIPELRNFEGRAIYMDVDQIILKDPVDLFNLPINEDKGWLALDSTRTDVMVYDCSKFKNLEGWPSLEEMKKSSYHIGNYIKLMKHLWQPLPHEWCCNDGGIESNQKNFFKSAPYDENKTCLLHYTQMDWQPWKPYPEKFNYPPHPHPRAESIWWQYYAKALEKEIESK